jgi:hypothetical protein
MVYFKIKDLYYLLNTFGLNKEADILYGLYKFADKRGNMRRLLGLTKEEADYFHNLSPQKSFDLARWFVEWRKENRNSYASLQDEIGDFNRNYSIGGDEDYLYEPEQYILFDIIIKDDSFYQSVKNKSLDEIFYSDGKKASPFELYVLGKGYQGFEFSPGKDYSWYNVGQECEIVSAFLKNCGSIGELAQEGEYGEASDFTMFALKDADKKPVMVITAGGTAFHPESSDYVSVIVNASGIGNKFPDDPELLEHLFNFARDNGYQFARIYDSKTGNQISQSPGLKEEVINGAGFQIINVYIGEGGSEEDEHEEDENFDDEE